MQTIENLQTLLELMHELKQHFNHWCSSQEVKTFEDLTHLIILKQFENAVPSRIATFINEHKVKTGEEAAILADDFVLIHAGNFTEKGSLEVNVKQNVPSMSPRFVRKSNFDLICNYCLKRGH